MCQTSAALSRVDLDHALGGCFCFEVNKVDLQGFCDIITERLKRLYDVLP